MSMKTGFFLSSGEAANNKEAVLQESKRLAGFFQETIVKLPARFFRYTSQSSSVLLS